jgi:hypothetical protein
VLKKMLTPLTCPCRMISSSLMYAPDPRYHNLDFIIAHPIGKRKSKLLHHRKMPLEGLFFGVPYAVIRYKYSVKRLWKKDSLKADK